MNKVSFVVIGVLFAASTMFFSCKKQIDNQLTGRWEKMAFVNSNDSDTAFWTFTNGNLYIENLSNPILSDTGKYVVVEKNLKNYVRLTQLDEPEGYQPLNGDWRVIQYRKDKLTLVKPDRKPGTDEPSGNIFREFIRVE